MIYFVFLLVSLYHTLTVIESHRIISLLLAPYRFYHFSIYHRCENICASFHFSSNGCIDHITWYDIFAHPSSSKIIWAISHYISKCVCVCATLYSTFQFNGFHSNFLDGLSSTHKKVCKKHSKQCRERFRYFFYAYGISANWLCFRSFPYFFLSAAAIGSLRLFLNLLHFHFHFFFIFGS